MERSAPRRARLLLPLLLSIPLATGCDRGPDEAVIALVFPIASEALVTVARETLSLTGDRSSDGARIRFEVEQVEEWESLDEHLERAQRLAQRPEVVGVVGHGGSRPDLAVAPVYAEHGVAHVSPSSTSRRLFRISPSTFLLAPDSREQGRFLARFAAEHLGARSVLLFFVNDEYGTELGEEVAVALDARGVELVDRIPLGQRNDPVPLFEAALLEGSVDLVIAAARAEAVGTLARLIDERGLDLPILAGDGAFNLPPLRERLGPAEPELYVTDFWQPSPDDEGVRSFVEAFQDVAGREPAWPSAFAYDGLLLLASAAREHGARRGAIRSYLERLGRDPPPFRGVTGPIDFSQERSPPLMVARITSSGPERVPFP